MKRGQWIDLRQCGKFWGRFDTVNGVLELSKGNVRATFHLDRIRQQHTQVAPADRQEAQNGEGQETTVA